MADYAEFNRRMGAATALEQAARRLERMLQSEPRSGAALAINNAIAACARIVRDEASKTRKG